jgi:hypothetical protein
MNLVVLGSTQRARRILSIICFLIIFLCVYWIYSTEFVYPNDLDVLSEAITTFASTERYPIEADVLEIREVDGVLIAYFRDENDQEIYGFAQLKKGFNQRYRIISTIFSPIAYASGIATYDFKTREGTYYAVGCVQCEDPIAAYGLQFINEKDQRKHLVTFSVTSPTFLTIHHDSDIQKLLREQSGLESTFDYDRFNIVLLNSSGLDVTENDRIGDVPWSSATGHAETFMLYINMAVVFIFGLVISIYFWNKK